MSVPMHLCEKSAPDNGVRGQLRFGDYRNNNNNQDYFVIEIKTNKNDYLVRNGVLIQLPKVNLKINVSQSIMVVY